MYDKHILKKELKFPNETNDILMQRRKRKRKEILKWKVNDYRV